MSQYSRKVNIQSLHNDSGEVFRVEVVDGLVQGKIERTISVNKRATKTDFTRIIDMGLPRATVDFLFKVINNMSLDGEVRGRPGTSPKNQKELCKAFGLPRSTGNVHVKALLENDVLRQYNKESYYVNPLYAYKFSSFNIPLIIDEVFPEMITRKSVPL